METKACNQADHPGPRELPLSEFYLKPRSPGGRDPACSTCRRRQLTLQNLAYRETCLDRYGRACACYGVTEELEIDHIDRNSRARGYAGTQLRAWLVNNYFPDGFQVLCRACNRSKGGTGACRRDHGAEARLPAAVLPARWEPPAGYESAGPRSRGKVIVAAWLASHAAGSMTALPAGPAR